MGKINGNAPRSNQAQNEQFKSVAKKTGLTQDQQANFHREISKKGLGYKELKMAAEEFKKK